MKAVKYTVFKTCWGYFSLAASDQGIIRSCLPMDSADEASMIITKDLAQAVRDDGAFSRDAILINRYFDGKSADFSDIQLDLSGLGEFSRRVLDACRRISAGTTVTYAKLAAAAGNPAAPRATAGALARNPIPLIIPCHRVVRTDGGLGGFSAPGGINTKQKLLAHEQIWNITSV